jgi:D-alanine-D-alanine ligase
MMQDDAGVVRCLEVNALPGLTKRSLLPLAADAAGLSYPTLIGRLLELTGSASAAAARVGSLAAQHL